MLSMVYRSESGDRNNHTNHLFQSRSESAAISDENPQKLRPRQSISLVTATKIREIFLSSRDGRRFAIPIAFGEQLSSRIRQYIESLEYEIRNMGRYESLDYSNRQSLEIPCSTDVLKVLVEFFAAKVQLELEAARDEVHMSEEEQNEHWRDYFYVRIAWRMDLDTFADETLKVAIFLRMRSLYELLRCCFRLKFHDLDYETIESRS